MNRVMFECECMFVSNERTLYYARVLFVMRLRLSDYNSIDIVSACHNITFFRGAPFKGQIDHEDCFFGLNVLCSLNVNGCGV